MESAGTKEQILAVACQLMRQQGIKRVTMDMIASTATVSKRTIYELFDSKDELVRVVFERMFAVDLAERLPEGNAMEQLLGLLYLIHRQVEQVNPLFYSDIREHYAEAYLDEQSKRRDQARYMMRDLLERGVREQVFRPQLPVELLLRMLVDMPLLVLSGWPEKSKNPLDMPLHAAMLTLLYELLAYGIATPSGYRTIQRVIDECGDIFPRFKTQTINNEQTPR